jgi:hypothetical protein
LQFLQRKQVAQNAWSPVRIARSSILLPQALQLYVQLLHIREPSPRRRRFASESSSVPQVLHRKQFRCHRLPAVDSLAMLNLDVGGSIVVMIWCFLRGDETEMAGEMDFDVPASIESSASNSSRKHPTLN